MKEDDEEIKHLLTEIRDILSKSSSKENPQKEILSTAELSKYTGYSTATIYKLTMDKMIPFSKPTRGKIIFIKRDIDAWLNERNQA